MKLLSEYVNGNYTVSIYDDGTKKRETYADEFIPKFAENIDLKISNSCDIGCPMCHEGSSKDGRQSSIIHEKFIDTLHPYQELAIGGGNIFTYPELISFLEKLKSLNVIANITVNQFHFEEYQNLIKYLVKEKLIYGLGVSVRYPTEELINTIKKYKNAVVHVINGLVTPQTINELSYKNLKLLILGYKEFNRGEEFYNENTKDIERCKDWLKENLTDILPRFKVVSFDNLAIKQLGVKDLLEEDEWEEFYMGDDSKYTFYIDAVERTFAGNSTVPKEQRYGLLDNVDEMFQTIVGTV